MKVQSILFFFFISSIFGMLCRNVVVAFEKTQNDKGTVTCAIDEPSLVIPLNQLSPLLSDPDSCVAPGALCALHCLQDSDCTNYNYRRNARTCEFFHYTPSNCAVVTGCYHAEIAGLQSCQAKATSASPSLTSATSSVATSTYKVSTLRTTIGTTLPRISMPALLFCETILGTSNILINANLGYGLDQPWSAYKYGFSDFNGGFVYAMDEVHRLTNNGNTWKVCLDLKDEFGTVISIVYNQFVLDSESAGYTYLMTGVTGSYDPFGATNRKYKFSTKDVNNQPCCCEEHAMRCKGGWWYSCTASTTSNTAVTNGVWKCGFFYSLPFGTPIQLQYSYMRIKQA